MSMVSDLVEPKAAETQRLTFAAAAGEWVIQHSWGVIFVGSLAFWMILGALLIWL